MEFRKDAKEFLEFLNKRKIPIIIISAEIGNFIEQFLIKNNCNFDDIYIVSNFIKFENEVAVGIYENIMHYLNKNEVNIPLKKKTFKIGFLEEKAKENKEKYIDEFDLVCTDNSNFFKIKKIFKEK